MTTIAVKGGVVATDTQISGNFIHGKGVIKIDKMSTHALLDFPEEIIVGGSGIYANCLEFMDWVRYSGMKVDYRFDEESDFFIVTKEGVYCFENYYKPFYVGEIYAAGSGTKFAMGAMMAGATAREAVEIAIKLDPYSGGDIVELKL